ncbi:hypothetical protein AF335_19525 [Streptomyces eurocidicus]|uniref:AcrR family transcriptional regulator n=1 Tax=Streptomyces eurocidicus TaxID=66423 RepID=A0A2N8NT99_STREU|nr:TetR/AcrR family transcriptional regulator C-terminal domain-containing protein [Streptomyces eurocidicus]MBB5119200.1 AcrR family transcriptional regulator [Streptomyces eurocidicus]MBF6056302.1 TetR family transcriptional regulator [Streptomyces eurocidicus]PNE31977.1 hypothetical protein AF335_19525 [Streptomyces eurocidicus]
MTPTPDATPDAPAAVPTAAERQAVARAARALLARQGWQRTTAEAIAASAGVSRDEVRAWAGDTGQLLLSVLLDSSASVAAHLADVAVARPGPGESVDLGTELTDLAHAWLSALDAFPEHFAIVRHLAAEITELPSGVAEKWQTAGPRQAHSDLAHRLRAVADSGLLDIDDADRAAVRFVQLTTLAVVQASFHGALPLAEEHTAVLVAQGVEDFLRLYRTGR